jgi:hypothetical protein
MRAIVLAAFAALVLTACGGPPSARQWFTPSALRVGAPAQRPQRGSRILPQAAHEDLVYIADYDDVLIYPYGSNTQVGKLIGFSAAQGMCTDEKGNVYITDFGAGDVEEFAHAQLRPIKTLIDPSPYPVDCGVDAKTGDLAVVNEYGASQYSQGSVAVYAQAKGKPKTYTNSAIQTYIGCDYDAGGNLLIDGYAGSKQNFLLLPVGSSKLEPAAIPGENGWLGPSYIRWDGVYFVVRYDQEFGGGSIFVFYKLDGTKGTAEGYMITTGSDDFPGRFWLGRVATKVRTGRANAIGVAVRDEGTLFWNYPMGGAAVYRNDATESPGGVTVSPAKR